MSGGVAFASGLTDNCPPDVIVGFFTEHCGSRYPFGDYALYLV